MRTDFHPGATAELEEAVEWYLKRSESAGIRFAQAVEAILNIEANPDPIRGIKVSPLLCGALSIQIVFRIDPHRLYVVAVAHAKRRPNYWRRRT